MFRHPLARSLILGAALAAPLAQPALANPFETTLANGMKVILVERPGLPVVQMNLQLNGGYAADLGGKLGTSSFTMGMLDEGAGEYDAIAFGNRAEMLGANLGAGSVVVDGGTLIGDGS